MLGNAFSPAYARARAQGGPADPLAHCTMNVVLHGPRARRFALTERGRASVHRTATALSIGPSVMRWEGDALVIDLDEATALFPVPVPGRIRGRETTALRHHRHPRPRVRRAPRQVQRLQVRAGSRPRHRRAPPVRGRTVEGSPRRGKHPREVVRRGGHAVAGGPVDLQAEACLLYTSDAADE